MTKAKSPFDPLGNIALVTPTVCRLMGMEPPALSTAEAMEPVVQAAAEELGGAPVEKCLVFAPDAVGAFLWENRRELFDPVLEHAPVRVPLLSIVPSKTPVCFASMFTGAMPPAHGIREAEKPVLTCDTFFDAVIRAGKRVALASTPGGCMDFFFRDRDMDYFIERRGDAVTDRAIELLHTGSHDVIVAYHSRYDGIVHRTHPESAEALEVAGGLMADFDRLGQAFDRAWQDHNRLIAFTPDHGAHFDPGMGVGGHGLDIAEDMEVHHFFGVRHASARALQ